MKRLTRLISAMAVLAMIAAACGDDDSTTTAATTSTTAADTSTTAADTSTTAGDTSTTAAAGGPLAEYGEDPGAADPDLVAKALGPVEPSDEASWNIILASIARAGDVDQATIDKAMECWSNQECDTGSGGELVMGYADGGGDTVNVWRGVSHMEAILQALTYPEIGTIVSTAANFDFDPEVHANQVRFLVQRGVDFIVGYPDVGVALADRLDPGRVHAVEDDLGLLHVVDVEALPLLDAGDASRRGDARGELRLAAPLAADVAVDGDLLLGELDLHLGGQRPVDVRGDDAGGGFEVGRRESDAGHLLPRRLFRFEQDAGVVLQDRRNPAGRALSFTVNQFDLAVAPGRRPRRSPSRPCAREWSPATSPTTTTWTRCSPM